MEYAVRVEGLTKYYGDILALDNVSFSVVKGEYVGYLGPNGAGKTTTIKILLGLIKPTRGYAEVLGVNVVKEPELVRGRVGYVQQGHSFELGLNVEQNLDLYGYLWGLSKEERRRRIKELMEVFGLEKYRKIYPNQLSIGLRRLLQVARELLHEPEILFLDEPTTGLDPAMRRRVLDYIFRWSRRNNVTIFLTTHIPQDIERLCRRIILIHKGKVKTDVDIEEFKKLFGGLSRVSFEFSSNVSESVKSILNEKLREYEAVVRFSNNSLDVFIKEEFIAKVTEVIILTAVNYGLRIANMKIQEPTLEDALVRAYLGD